MARGILRLSVLAMIAAVPSLALLTPFDAMSDTTRVAFLVVLLLDAVAFGANAEELLHSRERRTPTEHPADR